MQTKRKKQLRLTLLLPFLFCALSPAPSLALEPAEGPPGGRCILFRDTNVPAEADHFSFDIAHQSNTDYQAVTMAAYIKPHITQPRKDDPKWRPLARGEHCTPQKFLSHAFTDLDSPEKLRTELASFLPASSKPGATIRISLDASPALPERADLHLRQIAEELEELNTLLAAPNTTSATEDPEQTEERRRSYHSQLHDMLWSLAEPDFYVSSRQQALRDATRALFKGTSVELSDEGKAAIDKSVGIVNDVLQLSKHISAPDFVIYALPENHPNLTQEEKAQYKAYNEALERAFKENTEKLKEQQTPIGTLTLLREEVLPPVLPSS